MLLIIGLIVLLTNNIISIFYPKKVVYILQFLPAVLLIYLHSTYSYTLKPDIILIFSFLFSIGYIGLSKGSVRLKIVFIVFLSVILAYFFGGVSLILFCLLVTLTEIRNKKIGFINRLPGLPLL